VCPLQIHGGAPIIDILEPFSSSKIVQISSVFSSRQISKTFLSKQVKPNKNILTKTTGRWFWIKKPEYLVIKHNFCFGFCGTKNFTNYEDSPSPRPLLRAELEPVSRHCEMPFSKNIWWKFQCALNHFLNSKVSFSEICMARSVPKKWNLDKCVRNVTLLILISITERLSRWLRFGWVIC